MDTALTLHIKNVDAEASFNTESYLLDFVRDNNPFIARHDAMLDKDGYFSGIKLGVYGDTDVNDVSFDFLNQKILDKRNLSLLLNAENQKSTLGVGTGSINSLENIPSFRFFERVVIKKLPQLWQETKTINGTYRIIGFSSNSKRMSL